MKIFYKKDICPSQLYATFVFDKIKGTMRLVPDEVFNKKGRHLGMKDFDKACELKRDSEPGAKRYKWWMKYRAKDRSGLRREKRIGGESQASMEFTFERDHSSPSADFLGIKIEFVMQYEDEVAIFHAFKTANLGAECPWSLWTLRQNWNELCDPAWGAYWDSDSDSDEDPYIKDLKNRLGPKHPAVRANQRSIFESPYVENRPDWAWDVTGNWKVTSPMLAAVLDVHETESMWIGVRLANSVQHNLIGWQIWATFKFGDKLESCMRFCTPADSANTAFASLKDFEVSCFLKDGVWPGPAPDGQRKWAMRWRDTDPATFSRRRSPCCDEFETTISFDIDELGQLNMRGAMTCKFQPSTFTAAKIDEGAPAPGKASNIPTQWGFIQAIKSAALKRNAGSFSGLWLRLNCISI